LAVVIDVHPVGGGHAAHDGNEVAVVGGGTYRDLDHSDTLVPVIGGTAATSRQDEQRNGQQSPHGRYRKFNRHGVNGSFPPQTRR
jgi:hypothetical protein